MEIFQILSGQKVKTFQASGNLSYIPSSSTVLIATKWAIPWIPVIRSTRVNRWLLLSLSTQAQTQSIPLKNLRMQVSLLDSLEIRINGFKEDTKEGNTDKSTIPNRSQQAEQKITMEFLYLLKIYLFSLLLLKMELQVNLRLILTLLLSWIIYLLTMLIWIQHWSIKITSVKLKIFFPVIGSSQPSLLTPLSPIYTNQNSQMTNLFPPIGQKILLPLFRSPPQPFKIKHSYSNHPSFQVFLPPYTLTPPQADLVAQDSLESSDLEEAEFNGGSDSKIDKVRKTKIKGRFFQEIKRSARVQGKPQINYFKPNTL